MVTKRKYLEGSEKRDELQFELNEIEGWKLAIQETRQNVLVAPNISSSNRFERVHIVPKTFEFSPKSRFGQAIGRCGSGTVKPLRRFTATPDTHTRSVQLERVGRVFPLIMANWYAITTSRVRMQLAIKSIWRRNGLTGEWINSRVARRRFIVFPWKFRARRSISRDEKRTELFAYVGRLSFADRRWRTRRVRGARSGTRERQFRKLSPGKRGSNSLSRPCSPTPPCSSLPFLSLSLSLFASSFFTFFPPTRGICFGPACALENADKARVLSACAT